MPWRLADLGSGLSSTWQWHSALLLAEPSPEGPESEHPGGSRSVGSLRARATVGHCHGLDPLPALQISQMVSKYLLGMDTPPSLGLFPLLLWAIRTSKRAMGEKTDESRASHPRRTRAGTPEAPHVPLAILPLAGRGEAPLNRCKIHL